MIKSDYLRKLVARAAEDKKTIVLPEGEDMRVLEAAHIISEEKAVKIVILGDDEKIKKDFLAHGWSLDGIEFINPQTSSKKEAYTNLLFELRKEKGMTLEEAQATALDANYFGVLMVKAGDADGMVSGANHSTADTVRPALQIVKSKVKGKSASSFLIIVSNGKEYILSDCGIIPNPTDVELADIAIDAAMNAKAFGLSPKVAMLSYSTFGSGKGPDVDRVVSATNIAKEILAKEEYKNLGIDLDGEMQVDAALDVIVGKKKAPDSKVAGIANVLVFPDLGAANIGYKLLQRIGGCEAYGPMLQGLNAPINDLSRGALVEDIVGVIAITAIQARK